MHLFHHPCGKQFSFEYRTKTVKNLGRSVQPQYVATLPICRNLPICRKPLPICRKLSQYVVNLSQYVVIKTCQFNTICRKKNGWVSQYVVTKISYKIVNEKNLNFFIGYDLDEISQSTSESPEIHTKYSMKYFHQKNNFLSLLPL